MGLQEIINHVKKFPSNPKGNKKSQNVVNQEEELDMFQKVFSGSDGE